MNIIQTLTDEFSLALWQVENTVKLIDEDNTIPFIARYRKEATGSMDDQQLRALHERLVYLRNLEERKEQVLRSLEEHGHLTDEIAVALHDAATLTAVEDIYRPYKPKRRTRATIAEERGLKPLAELVFAQELDADIYAAAAQFVDPEKGVETAEEALAGASDIIAERISDDPLCRSLVRNMTQKEGIIRTSIAKKAEEALDKDKRAGVYDMYAEFHEPIIKMAGHRILAINRGEKENQLKVALEAPTDDIIAGLQDLFIKNNPNTLLIMQDALADSYKRLTAPAVEREIRTELTERAEEGAIKVFSENLRQLLLQPPIKGHMVLAIDPGFRTGCKLAVVNDTGKVLETGVVYCTIGNQTAAAKSKLAQMVTTHGVNIIAIGNGTASRETEAVVAELLRETDLTAQYIIVNEAGASVYSASPLAAEEFPDFDVSLRSAASIGRRLQDPLAELVKIDPKSIGVGQYQHDMNQKRLGDTLSTVVEDCVNSVGVDLNTASPSLLSYVAGVSTAIAKNILEYREENGKFESRKELLKVKKLGPKTFKQCAGFMRIPDGTNPLDNTGVHPESYDVAQKYLAQAEKSPRIEDIAKELAVGVPTLKDIIKELAKPGRDPREDLPPPLLRSDVLDMKDLTEGMTLQGTVRNVIDFGAFVDIGVHQDGLVHISQLSNRFIKHPLEAVSVGDVVTVRVLSVDIAKKRIALSMKLGEGK
ncbi:MAG: RNA-binding transcriptional accessory protein [Defluviitaleaceae bacterium]|nr:RNA-binding transcriptional accessory protein [Defluviitaleaceae bacterium]